MSNSIVTVYVISGCCGAGKTTLAKALVKNISNAVLISGDVVHDMFPDPSITNWDARLKITWQNILLLAHNFLQNGINVIIDYVVEDELTLLIQSFSEFNVEIKYVVMTADESCIKERLINRGDEYLIERALFLREKLITDKNNKPYIYEGANKPLDIQVNDIQHITIYPV